MVVTANKRSKKGVSFICWIRVEGSLAIKETYSSDVDVDNRRKQIQFVASLFDFTTIFMAWSVWVSLPRCF